MTTTLPRPALRVPLLRFHRRVPYWFTAGVVAATTAGLVGHLVGAAAAERDRWGAVRAAVVVTADAPAGTHLGTNDVAVRRLPASLVPHDALDALPAGAVAAVDLHAGETLLGARLAGRPISTVAARLPAATRGIAVPAGAGLPLEVGDRVDVLATFDRASAGADPTFAVARDALVVHVARDAVTVAVAGAAAPKVAYALATGTVTLVLVGGS